MFSEGLNILGFDDTGSNSAEESSANEESNDASDDFSANEPSTSKKNGSPCGITCPYGSRRGVRTKSHD